MAMDDTILSPTSSVWEHETPFACHKWSRPNLSPDLWHEALWKLARWHHHWNHLGSKFGHGSHSSLSRYRGWKMNPEDCKAYSCWWRLICTTFGRVTVVKCFQQMIATSSLSLDKKHWTQCDVQWILWDCFTFWVIPISLLLKKNNEIISILQKNFETSRHSSLASPKSEASGHADVALAHVSLPVMEGISCHGRETPREMEWACS